MRITRMGALVATAVLITTGAFSGTASATHAWGSYHWARLANPFTLSVGDNVTSAWDSYLDTANSQWSQSAVLNLTKTAGSTTGKQCRAKAGRVEVCNAAYGQNGWLGLASISITGGTHITQGTVKLNDTYFAMPQYNTPDERAHVMCQEIGHTLGLGHTSEDGSSQKTCMDYSTDPGSTAPNAHDYAQLEAIYAHTDTTTTIGSSASPGGGKGHGNAPAAWGREVERSADGEHSTFLKKFDDGTMVLTDVTWAN